MADALPPLLPFWSDTFDTDLVKVVPGVREALGDAAEIPLWTFNSNPTHGRINLPCVWNTDRGCTAFFTSREDGVIVPAQYMTGRAARIGCTWLELLRDVWVHEFCAVVDRRVVLDEHATRGPFYALMYDVRRITPLSDAARAQQQAEALAVVRRATDALRRVLGRCV